MAGKQLSNTWFGTFWVKVLFAMHAHCMHASHIHANTVDFEVLHFRARDRKEEEEGLRSLLMKTKVELKEAREKIIELEDYTRRENLKFHNIPEANDEGATQSSKQVILHILEKELQMDTTDIRFQAVHRIGRRKENRNRPIIARFVCREDRDRVFSRKQALKESRRYRDAYITADYAKAIQEERRKLIKAMFKVKEQGLQAKVVGRFLHIGEQKYNVTNVPEDFEDD